MSSTESIGMGAETIVDILQTCRQQLQLAASTPLSIDNVLIGDISKECNVAVAELKELRESHRREVELDTKLDEVRHLPNKMEYSNVVKEIAVVKSKIRELTNEINHSIRNHPELLNNKQRCKIEIDRLDDILRITQLELAEYDDTPTIREETQDYVPLKTARDQSLASMKQTLKSLDVVRETLQREKEEHRDIVYDLKVAIKSTRADIQAMENGTYAPAVEFNNKLAQRRKAQTVELKNKRKSIEDEIEQIQTNMSKDTLVHEANMSKLKTEEVKLEQTLADTTKDNAASMQAIESSLSKLKAEQAENHVVLQELEQRLADEKHQQERDEEEREKRLQRVIEQKKHEELVYFAALWIQLSWKRFLKRKALKQSSKKGKGKKGKGGKKKK